MYLTIKETAKKYTFLTERHLRYLTSTNKRFADKCVRRFEKKILIKEKELLKYIENSRIHKK